MFITISLVVALQLEPLLQWQKLEPWSPLKNEFSVEVIVNNLASRNAIAHAIERGKLTAILADCGYRKILGQARNVPLAVIRGCPITILMMKIVALIFRSFLLKS